MSDNIKLLLLPGYNLYMFLGLAVCCQLERNEFNKYPWMLKLVVDGEMRGPGSLVTPYKVMSSASPFLKIIGAFRIPDLSPIVFVGFRLKKEGIVECSVTRKAIKVESNRDDQDLVFWVLKKKFDVALSIPFMWARIEDVNAIVIAKTVHNMKHDEICILPVFETASPTDAKIKLDSASFVSGIKGDHFLQKYCNYDEMCFQTTKDEAFLAMATVTHMPGQVIICRGLAVGAQRKRLRIDAGKQSNETEYGPTMYDNFGFKANIYHEWAVREWPSTPKPRKTTTTVADVDTIAFSIGKRLEGKRPSTAKAHVRKKKKTKEGPTKPTTFASSVIPSALAMTPLKTTTQLTQMFVRTLPNHVRAKGRSVSRACTNSPSLVIIIHCSVLKLALFNYFTLHALNYSNYIEGYFQCNILFEMYEPCKPCNFRTYELKM